jgi:hypothetical protein
VSRFRPAGFLCLPEVLALSGFAGSIAVALSVDTPSKFGSWIGNLLEGGSNCDNY